MNEVTKTNTSVPAYMQGQDNYSGDIDIKEVKIPMIKLAQLPSDEVAKGAVKYGELFSTIGEVFGKSANFVIIKPWINYVKFETGEGLVGRSSDGKTWNEGKLAGTPVDQNEVYKYKRYNFYVIRTDKVDPLPYCISMYSSSGAKEGSKLYNLIAASILKEKVPCFGIEYTFKSKEDSNDKGKFSAWSVEKVGFTTDEIFKQAMAARLFIESNADIIKVHDEVVEVKPVAAQETVDY